MIYFYTFLLYLFWNNVHELVVKILWGYFVHLFYNSLNSIPLNIEMKLHKKFNRQSLIHVCMFYLYNSMYLRSSSHHQYLNKYHYYLFIQFPHTDLFHYLLSITPYVSQIELPLAWFFLSFNQTIIKHNIINIGKTILFLEWKGEMYYKYCSQRLNLDSFQYLLKVIKRCAFHVWAMV